MNHNANVSSRSLPLERRRWGLNENDCGEGARAEVCRGEII